MADIVIRKLSKSFGKQPIITGLDLDISTGEFWVILGPSGCGKSTLLRLIAGLEDINGGEIHIDGLLVNDKEPRDRGCAMVFQNYALYPHMTVAENIGYALRVAGVPRHQRRQPVEEVAAILSLSDYLDRKPGELSGGQRQRVAMGRAIIRKPRVFLFDEPLSNLDAKLRVQMRLEIRKLHARLGVTSLLVTHDQVEAMTMADRLLVMKDGSIEQAGTPDQIYSQPASIYVAGFVGSPPMNLLTVRAIDNSDTHQFAYAILDDNQRLPLAPNILLTNQTTHLTTGFRAENVSILNPDGTELNELSNNGYPVENAGKHHHQAKLKVFVEFIEDLGSHRLYHCTLHNQSLCVQSTEKPGITVGDVIYISIEAARLHWFDSHSGKRLS